MTRIYPLNVKEYNRAPKRLIFDNKKARDGYLKAERDKAVFRRLEYTYRRGEYLRVYRNAMTLIEYDIINDKRAQAALEWKGMF